MPDIKEVRCINCNKKLAEVTLPQINMSVASTSLIQEGIQIKCPRCSVVSAVHYLPLTSIAQSAIS